MSKYLSSRLSKLVPYTPGEQPQNLSEFIKLNTNENPYFTSRYAVEKITEKEVENLRLYSDPTAKMLVDEIANYYGFSRDNVIVSNGSDEVLAFCFKAFCDEEREICFPDITYGFYEVYANLMNLKVNKIPLKEDFTIDINDYIDCGKNVIFANPNAQTGISLSVDDIEKIVSSNSDYAVIVDEAYVDFGGETVLPLVKKYDNLVVIRTFSKSRSLAGGRVGFAIGSKDIILDLQTVKNSFNPYNLNRLSIICATESIKDDKYFLSCVEKIISTRERFVKNLVELGFEVLPSKANFVMAKPTFMDAEKLYLTLKEMGVLVRYFKDSRIKDYLRISIGTDSDMDTLIEKIKLIKGSIK